MSKTLTKNANFPLNSLRELNTLISALNFAVMAAEEIGHPDTARDFTTMRDRARAIKNWKGSYINYAPSMED